MNKKQILSIYKLLNIYVKTCPDVIFELPTKHFKSSTMENCLKAYTFYNQRKQKYLFL